jgi:E3 ubiquitin-protein ligase TRIP12
MVVAKSIQDDRVLDVHFNPVFFRRVLGMPVGSFEDLASVDPVLYASLGKLHAMLGQREAVPLDDSLSAEGKDAAIAKLEADVEGLYQDFVLPGYDIDLVEGGADKAVTLDNLKEYLDVSAWCKVWLCKVWSRLLLRKSRC